MNHYTVEITREGDAWIADVLDLPGAHTYARNLAVLRRDVDEVIQLVTNAPDGTPPPTLSWIYRDIDPRFQRAAAVGEARAQAAHEQAVLATRTTEAVHDLVHAGYSVRDIGVALHLTPGRVSQIAKTAR